MEKIKVVIEDFGDEFGIYNEAGQCIEPDFNSYEEAKEWAEDNGYEVVESFHI